MWTTVAAILRDRKYEMLHVFMNAGSVGGPSRGHRKEASGDVSCSIIKHRQKADADFKLQSTETFEGRPCHD